MLDTSDNGMEVKQVMKIFLRDNGLVFFKHPENDAREQWNKANNMY